MSNTPTDVLEFNFGANSWVLSFDGRRATIARTEV